MASILFFLSFFLLLLGGLVLYKPAWILFFNRLAREKVFNDQFVLAARRKSAAFCLLLALIFIGTGYYYGYYTETKFIMKIISADRLLYQSLQHLHSNQYEKAKTLAERVILTEPNHPEALYHLAAAQFMLNDRKSAEISFLKAQKLDQDSPQMQYLAQYVMQIKNSTLQSTK